MKECWKNFGDTLPLAVVHLCVMVVVRPSNRIFCMKVHRVTAGWRKACRFTVTEGRCTMLDKIHVRPGELLPFISVFLSRARTQHGAEEWLGRARDTCALWRRVCYQVCVLAQ